MTIKNKLNLINANLITKNVVEIAEETQYTSQSMDAIVVVSTRNNELRTTIEAIVSRLTSDADNLENELSKFKI